MIDEMTVAMQLQGTGSLLRSQLRRRIVSSVGRHDEALDVDHRREREDAAGAVPRAAIAFPTLNLIRIADKGKADATKADNTLI